MEIEFYSKGNAVRDSKGNPVKTSNALKDEEEPKKKPTLEEQRKGAEMWNSFMGSMGKEGMKVPVPGVSENNNKHYYQLIKAFNNLTNVPVLVNTSLNLPGEVLVETLYDLYCMFTESDLKYIYLPEIKKIIIK